jgi:hypothetical protein
LTSFSQITITYDNQTEDISGQAYNIVAPNYQAFDVPFNIKNETGVTKQWRVTRYQLNVPTGWSDYLCWGHGTDPFGGTCFSSTQMSGNPWTSPSNAALQFDVNNGEYAKLKVTIDADDWVSGTGHYRYYISENGFDYVDSVDLIVQFTANLNNAQKELISVSKDSKTVLFNLFFIKSSFSSLISPRNFKVKCKFSDSINLPLNSGRDCCIL